MFTISESNLNGAAKEKCRYEDSKEVGKSEDDLLLSSRRYFKCINNCSLIRMGIIPSSLLPNDGDKSCRRDESAHLPLPKPDSELRNTHSLLGS